MKKQKSFRERVEAFASSERGQRLWHYGYSWGACAIILGAMFKILHFPYANEILFVAMTLEAFIFFMSAFDKSYETKKTEEDYPKESTDQSSALTPIKTVAKHAGENPDLRHYTHQYNEQLEVLGRHIQDINEMYEHVVPDSFRIRMETEKMVRQMEHLNKIYTRLIQSMTHTDLSKDRLHKEEEEYE